MSGTPEKTVTKQKKRPKLKVKLDPEAVKADHPPSPPRNLSDKATLTVNGQEFECNAGELERLEELGRGAYGVVDKMIHRPTEKIMAVKRIRAGVNSKEQRRLVMDLDVSMRVSDCPFMVHFYGALFREGDVWICMELMTTSLDKFYRQVYSKPERVIPENILGKIVLSVVKALHYLHSNLHVIHRDVKPSNILVEDAGNFKLCDFGISGQLVDSLAKTMDAGCKPYMAPERINPARDTKGYDIRSDVWSLGITMIELATGKFPYENWKTPFEQLKQVVQDPAPILPDDGDFSPELREVATNCLMKDYTRRPNYPQLLDHKFLQTYSGMEFDESMWTAEILEEMRQSRAEAS